MVPLFFTLILVSTVAVQDARVMTAVPNVRLRAAPSVESDVIREESLGSVYHVKERRPDGWLRVDFGYVREELTRPFTPATRAAVTEEIIRAQLDRPGAGFEAWNQLISLSMTLIARDDDREAAARFALYELEALRGAAGTAGGLFRTPFAFHLGEYSRAFVNHEPGGQWMLRREYIVDVHDEFAGTAAADDIAWFAAENGLPGECEGDPQCHAYVANTLYGEYLRRYPSGRHVDDAIEQARLWLHHGTHNPAQAGIYREGCAEVRKQVGALSEAVAGAASPRGAAFRQTAEVFTAICR